VAGIYSVRPPRCAEILVYCSVRDTRLLRHRIKKISTFTRPHVIGFVADLIFSTLAPSTRYRICYGLIFFLSGERIHFFRIRCRIRQIRVDGNRIRKEKVEDSKISGYVKTGPNSALQNGKKYVRSESDNVWTGESRYFRNPMT